jgi:hypothetical protein
VKAKVKITMKTNIKLKLAATAAAVLATGILSQNAKAGAIAGQQYDATLENVSELGYAGDTFVVRSTAALVTAPGTYQGDYEYMYDFGVSGDVNKNGPPVGIASLSVYFSDTAGVVGAGGVTGPAAPQTVAGSDVNWTFNPVTKEETVFFFSPDAPGFGTASAQNGGLWGQVANSSALATDLSGAGMNPLSLVVVPVPPTVPDSATTLSLLGGALVGLGALRRKIGC